MAGGEPVRIHLLHKNGMSIGGATATVVGERMFDAIFVLISVPFALFLFKEIIEVEAVRNGLYIGMALFGMLLILFVYTLKNPEKIKSLLIFIDKLFRRVTRRKSQEKNKKLIKKIIREVDNFHESIFFFITKRRKECLMIGIITVLFWSTGFMIPSLLLLGLGSNPMIIESYAAQVLLLVIVMIPTTPGSAGIAEAGTGLLYAPLIGRPILGVFVFFFRIITYYMNLVAGAIFQYKIFK
jgi:uncharacterized protein (TIRG00374 family)